MLDVAASILLKLIESQKLRNDGGYQDEAESHLCAHIDFVGAQLSKLVVTEGRLDSVETAWWLASKLAKSIHDLALGCKALKTPEQKRKHYSLQNVASDKLLMPSLRAKLKSFTYDCDDVAKIVGLSRACAINIGIGSNPKYSFKSYPTVFVAEFIEEVTRWKRVLNRQRAAFDFQQAKRLKPQMSFRDYLKQNYPNELVEKLLCYYKLPPFTIAAKDEWWTKAIKPYLEERKTLTMLHSRFLKDLQDSTTNREDYEVRDELKRRCRQVIYGATFAKPSAAPAPL
jgi:hypothetical protein